MVVTEEEIDHKTFLARASVKVHCKAKSLKEALDVKLLHYERLANVHSQQHYKIQNEKMTMNINTICVITDVN